MSEHVTKAFAAIVKATTTDPTGHLPNCGYTDESQVCGCAAWGARLHDALTASLGDAYQRGQRDLAAKVEALCDQEWLCATASDDALHPAVPVEHLRALLADALPQDADSEPASVPLAAEQASGASVDVPGAEGLSEAQETCGLEFGDGYTCDLPKGHDEDETRDGGAGL
ncbi:MAG TPA: hypothetical protein VFH56_11045 [Acidimicrobiales bacterium]|nr:hypothetical protein [Acidimicrobiales bacterium]